jgi:ribosome-binding factor A
LSTQRRLARVAQAIKQVVSQAILTEMRDPRARNITVIHVEVPEDLRSAKVYVSVMGDEKMERLSVKGLDAARGWLQQKIAEELDLRWTPLLTFIIDPGVKKSLEISRQLREALPPTDDDAEELDEDETESDEADLESEAEPKAADESGEPTG